MQSNCNAEVRIGKRASGSPPSIGRLAARYDAAMMARVQQNAVCNTAYKVKGHICRWLLELPDRSGDDSLAPSVRAFLLGPYRAVAQRILKIKNSNAPAVRRLEEEDWNG
jgi:hypothetical protein